MESGKIIISHGPGGHSHIHQEEVVSPNALPGGLDDEGQALVAGVEAEEHIEQQKLNVESIIRQMRYDSFLIKNEYKRKVQETQHQLEAEAENYDREADQKANAHFLNMQKIEHGQALENETAKKTGELADAKHDQQVVTMQHDINEQRRKVEQGTEDVLTSEGEKKSEHLQKIVPQRKKRRADAVKNTELELSDVEDDAATERKILELKREKQQMKLLQEERRAQHTTDAAVTERKSKHTVHMQGLQGERTIKGIDRDAEDEILQTEAEIFKVGIIQLVKRATQTISSFNNSYQSAIDPEADNPFENVSPDALSMLKTQIDDILKQIDIFIETEENNIIKYAPFIQPELQNLYKVKEQCVKSIQDIDVTISTIALLDD